MLTILSHLQFRGRWRHRIPFNMILINHFAKSKKKVRGGRDDTADDSSAQEDIVQLPDLKPYETRMENLVNKMIEDFSKLKGILLKIID